MCIASLFQYLNIVQQRIGEFVMFVKEVMVKNQVGLHARPATFFIQKANEFKSSIWIEKEVLNTKAREDLGWIIKEPIQAFGAKHNIEIHYSGMPYIRTAIAAKVKHELKFFVLVALHIRIKLHHKAT